MKAPERPVSRRMTRMQVCEDDYERLPGLYLRWELPEILLIGGEYRIEPGARTTDGATLVAVFRRVGNHEGKATE